MVDIRKYLILSSRCREKLVFKSGETILKLINFLFFICAIAPIYLPAQDIVVRTPCGDHLVIDVQPGDSFLGTIEVLQSAFDSGNEFLLDFMGIFPEVSAKKGSAVVAFRNYLAPLTTDERKDIGYIVSTLGMSSLVKIAKSESSLKKAGKRIDHVHPLQFLGCVFTDENLKASIHAMEGRSWVWSEFVSGLKDSLECESNRDNMKLEFISDFAGKVGIHLDIILPAISAHQWSELIGLLITHIPRNSDNGRYDM